MQMGRNTIPKASINFDRRTNEFSDRFYVIDLRILKHSLFEFTNIIIECIIIYKQ